MAPKPVPPPEPEPTADPIVDDDPPPPAPKPAPAPKGEDVSKEFVEDFNKLIRWAKGQGYNPEQSDEPAPVPIVAPTEPPQKHTASECMLGAMCPYAAEHGSA